MPDLRRFNEKLLRVYAPLGSKLISNAGFDYKIFRISNHAKLQNRPGLTCGERDIWVKDVASGTAVEQESRVFW